MDYLHRPELIGRFEQVPRSPLVLVSAPAGYGKSMLVSAWLEKCKRPGAWLSLDENDNDFHLFISYFVAAVQTIFPKALPNTAALINSPSLPPESVLTATLINEQEQIGQEFVIVLDDIHHIREELVLDFLKRILNHPVRHMQLCLIGRRDPIVPIASLRARGLLTEIRMLDLSFSVEEAVDFLTVAMAQRINKSTAAALAEKAEGWVTALRLTALAIGGQNELSHKLLELKGTTRYVVDYLIHEVFDSQPTGIQHFLLSTSILNRFCAPLCNALFNKGETAEKSEIDGYEVINGLQANNLFIIPLDTENRWFRYHHLFQQLLKDRLNKQWGPEEISALHTRASAWFEKNDLINEAIDHAILGGDFRGAITIVQRHRYTALNDDKWFIVKNWLRVIPDKIINQSRELLLTKAWVLNHQFRLDEIPEILECADAISERETGKQTLAGELCFFKAFLLFWEGRIAASIEMSKKAQDQIPKEDKYDLIRGDNEIYHAMALQMNGKGDIAIRELQEKIDCNMKQKGMYATRLASTPCFVHLLSGDLKRVKTSSLQLKNISKKSGLLYAYSWSEYMLACCGFHTYDLDKARHHFAAASEYKYNMHVSQAANCLAGLAMTYQAMGRTEDADATMDQLTEFAMEINEPNIIAIAQSAKVRLSLIQGNLEPGIKWIGSFDELPHISSFFVWLELPHVTLCRVLLTMGTEESLIKASEWLERLLEMAGTIHNTFHKIDMLVLKGLALYKLSRIRASLKVLEEAVNMAIPGGWVRPFIEPGAEISELLIRLKQQNISIEYIQKLLAVFPSSSAPSLGPITPPSYSTQPLVEPLTFRELDVLALLSERLQNKEIAASLFISTTTVKTHLKHIYQKLRVNNRQEAVEKAKAIRILSP